MFENTSSSVDRLVRLLAQNFEARYDSPLLKTNRKINFMSHVEKILKTKRELLLVTEKIKDIILRQNLDFSDEKTVQLFVERHTNFLDKLLYPNNASLSTSHLKSINKRIIQKVMTRAGGISTIKRTEERAYHKNESYSRKPKISSGGDFRPRDRRNKNFCISFKESSFADKSHEGTKQRRMILLRNSKTLCQSSMTSRRDKLVDSLRVKQCEVQRQRSKIDLASYDRRRTQDKYNLMNRIAQCTKKEIEMAEKFFRLSIKDAEFIKKNVHVTLYIDAKELKYNDRIIQEERYDRLVLLCQRAILCLIEPSEKAFVLLEGNLSIRIQKYLSQEYDYHFDSQRNSEESYCALLLLSYWAKVLLRQPEMTVVRTLCAILKCSVQRILILSCLEEKKRHKPLN